MTPSNISLFHFQQQPKHLYNILAVGFCACWQYFLGYGVIKKEKQPLEILILKPVDCNVKICVSL